MARKPRRRTAATPGYPALVLWHRLTEQGRQRLAQETRIRLWRAACWEQSASTYRGTSPTREQDGQIQAIDALLFGWTNGDWPGTDDNPAPKREHVTLSQVWQRKYLSALQAIAETAERAA